MEEQPVTGKRQKSPTSFHDPNDGGEGDILGSSNGDAPVVVDLISNLPPAPKYFTSGGCSHMDRWGSFFCLLVEYRFEKGHANPKKTEEYRSRKLGQWCSEQRKNYQKRVRGMLSAQSRLMSDERIALLVAVGMQFSKQQDPQAFVSIQGAKTWDGMLDLLKRYHREKGHLNPGETEVFCGERIGVWCCRQKEAFRAKQEGSSSSASGYQVCNYCTNRLIQTGFDFAAGPPPAQATSHSLHPHPGSATAMGEISDPLAHQMTPLMPPISSSSNAHAIASPTPTISDMPIPAGLIPASSLEGMMGTLDPISGQPTAMARSLTPVTPGEVQSVSSPKPDGDSPSSNATSSGKSSAIKSKKTDEGSAWDEMFNLLVEYSKEHGHVAPRWGENFNEKKLGRWVSTQREAFKKRKNGKLAANSCRMSDERIAKLNGIGFSWETAAGKASSSSWDDVFQILCRYKNLHGHCCPTEKEEYEGKLIGRWVKTQVRYPFIFCRGNAVPLEETHLLFPACLEQREAFRMRQQGKLKETSCRMSDDRIRMLNDIGFVWDAREQTNSVSASAGKTPTSNSWEDGYNVMVAYKATHGHSCPTEKEEFTCPNTGNIHKVGRWAKTQREAYRMRQQGKLSSTSCRMNDERIALLEKIDFVWDARNRNDVASSSSTSGIKQDETVRNAFREGLK